VQNAGADNFILPVPLSSLVPVVTQFALSNTFHSAFFSVGLLSSIQLIAVGAGQGRTPADFYNVLP
jgi:hypothetical protein